MNKSRKITVTLDLQAVISFYADDRPKINARNLKQIKHWVLDTLKDAGFIPLFNGSTWGDELTDKGSHTLKKIKVRNL